jgi:hypothetical protein
MEKELKAINKWFYFTMNYPDDFIEKVWADEEWLVEHLKGKFRHYYEDYGSHGVLSAFYAALDNGNRIKLLTWVMENYNSEQELNFKEPEL